MVVLQGVVSLKFSISWFPALATGVAYWGYVISGYCLKFMSGCLPFVGLFCFLYLIPSFLRCRCRCCGCGEKKDTSVP